MSAREAESLSVAGIRRFAAHRATVEIALLAAIGIFLAVIGPYQTGTMPLTTRLVYWLVCIVGGGIIGIAIETSVAGVLRPTKLRVFTISILMTPLVSLLVMMTGALLAAQATRLAQYIELLWQVFVIALPVMAVRALAWRRQKVLIQTRTVIEPPLPAAETVFRRRLSAKRRTARLIAIEAHDHYIRVHTDAGSELLTLRFADALAELEGAHGYRIHRSWWVSGESIEAVKWRRGAGEAMLIGQLVAPVSRGHAEALRIAGWL